MANNDTHLQQSKKIKLADEDDDVSSDGEEARCEPLKPTRYSIGETCIISDPIVLFHSSGCSCRYGRMPKPTKPLTYPTKEDTHSSPTEDAPASPMGLSAPRPKSKCPAKKKGKMPSAPEPKRPKLITLRASQSEYSDDEDENQGWPGPEQQLVCGGSRDSTAAFVPASLCSLHPVTVEVEETMEEVQGVLLLSAQIHVIHSFNFLQLSSFSVDVRFFVHGFTLHFQTLRSTLSSISWPACPTCWASPKML